MTVNWKDARGRVWLKRRCVNGSGRTEQAPSEDRSLSAVWEVKDALCHRWDVVKHSQDRRDSRTGREGTQRAGRAPGWGVEYGSLNAFSQPHHAGAFKLAPFQSHQPSCGLLEQLEPAVSTCSSLC